MKKWFSKLTKDQIQRFVFLGLLVIVFSAFFIALGINSSDEENNTPDTTDPIESDEPNNTPVVVAQTFILPTNDSTCTIVRSYYSSTAETSEQEKAVIQYGSRYFVSTGIALQNEAGTDFKVVASLDGTVESVEESPIYGIVVVIKHDDDVYTEYSSLSSTVLKQGDTITQGTIIGVSGKCEYDSTLPSHVYFKVAVNSKTVNPVSVIGKTIANVK